MIGWTVERRPLTSSVRRLLILRNGSVFLQISRRNWRSRNGDFGHLKCGYLDTWTSGVGRRHERRAPRRHKGWITRTYSHVYWEQTAVASVAVLFIFSLSNIDIWMLGRRLDSATRGHPT